MAPSEKQRVAVLGGGIGALAAAFKLTQQENWQDRFEITVYQLGWRLGGKGASARNAARNNRIEEHGLHVWAGFYENAFAMMNEVYRDLHRPESPIQTIEQAFLPERHVTLAEHCKTDQADQWLPWKLYFPEQPGKPGDGAAASLPNVLGYLRYLLDCLHGIHAQFPEEVRSATPAAQTMAASDRVRTLVTLPPDAPAIDQILHAARAFAAHADVAALGHAVVSDGIGALVQGYRRELIDLKDLIDRGDTTLRRTFITADLVSCVISVILNEGVLFHGFSVLDQYDLIEVLQKHHAQPMTLASPFVVSAYDYVFGYRGGDRARPSFSAASAFEGFLRLLFTYKNALFFKMAAGAGEIIFAPVYQVLRERGVKFEFFHRVLELLPKDGRIDSVRIAVQGKPCAVEYEPLVDVGGLPCWPAEPRYDLLVNGDELSRRGIDLESDGQDYSIAEKVLMAGSDFDAVILGIPPGALSKVASALATPGSRWRRMLDKVGTVNTQALQLWCNCNLRDFGGPFVAPDVDPDEVGPILTGFDGPLDTWSDMSHLLKQEEWGATPPQNLAYFCAVLADQPEAAPGADPQASANAQVRAGVVSWLEQKIGGLWPNAVGPSGFLWSLLHGEAGSSGPDRLDERYQYWRANIGGSERYVLSLPGTLDARLPPGPTEYGNLYLAGDWVRVSAINAGCMEVAVMAGFGAAAALAGVPDDTVS